MLTHEQRDNLINRAQGALLGLAIGDALGAPHETNTPKIEGNWANRLKGPIVDITGGGPRGFQAGDVTDDTQMMLVLARHIAERGGVHPGDLAKEYVEWLPHGVGVGGHIKLALQFAEKGSKQPGKDAWLEAGRGKQTNGSLMRTAAIGALCATESVFTLVKMSLMDSAITHYSPYCQLACAAYNCALASLVRGSTGREAFVAAANGLMYGSNRLLDQEEPEDADYFKELVLEAGKYLFEDLILSTQDNNRLDSYPNMQDALHRGNVRVAFRLAFSEYNSGFPFRESLVDVVNRGGDTDTNGAIVGALLGAYYGAKSLPQDWKDKVLERFTTVNVQNPQQIEALVQNHYTRLATHRS